MEVDSDAVIARQFPFTSHPLKKVTISSNGTNFLPTRSAKGRARNHEVLEGHGTFDFLKAAGPRNRQMWARPWPAGWHVPSMATSQHPAMNELGDTLKEQMIQNHLGLWLPEVCRGTRSRHMMEETRWLKENKQMWCQQLTTTRTEGSRREIRCSSNLLLHCPSASCSWGMVVKNRGRHCPRFDTFLNQTPFLFAQYLIYRPRHLPTEQKPTSWKWSSTVRSRWNLSWKGHLRFFSGWNGSKAFNRWTTKSLGVPVRLSVKKLIFSMKLTHHDLKY